MCYNEGEIEVPPARVRTADGCMLYGVTHLMSKYTPEQQLEKFWSRVAITADDNQCWLWQASGTCGYGHSRWNGKLQRAHRISWMLPDYVIPDGMDICHSCDNRKCVNPKHLFLGTTQDNIDDMIAKGRKAVLKGAEHGMARLTALQVIEIRKRWEMGGVTQIQLGKEYGVRNTQISNIVLGLQWKELL